MDVRELETIINNYSWQSIVQRPDFKDLYRQILKYKTKYEKILDKEIKAWVEENWQDQVFVYQVGQGLIWDQESFYSAKTVNASKPILRQFNPAIFKALMHRNIMVWGAVPYVIIQGRSYQRVRSLNRALCNLKLDYINHLRNKFWNRFSPQVGFNGIDIQINIPEYYFQGYLIKIPLIASIRAPQDFKNAEPYQLNVYWKTSYRYAAYHTIHPHINAMSRQNWVACCFEEYKQALFDIIKDPDTGLEDIEALLLSYLNSYNKPNAYYPPENIFWPASTIFKGDECLNPFDLVSLAQLEELKPKGVNNAIRTNIIS